MQWGPQALRDRLVQPEPKVMQARQGHEVKGDLRGHRVFRGRLVRQVLRVKRGHEVCREKQEDRARQVHRARQVNPAQQVRQVPQALGEKPAPQAVSPVFRMPAHHRKVLYS